MKIIYFFLAVVFSIALKAQSIQGVLVDENNEPLPFATIQLLNADTSLVKVEMSKVDGTFKFNNLKAANFFIEVNYLGYEVLKKEVDLAVNDGNLKMLKLVRKSMALDAVEIKAEKPMIEVEPDKTVFNVSKNLSSTGDDGVELLRKAPGMQIDNNDNIILEGKSGVNVYINGKQTFLQGEDLSNYLKSIRAEEIEKVEIITQPSSKYDAAGNAGIINIVLKREKGLGTKGSITNTFTYGKYVRNNTTLNLNYRSKKFASFATLSHFQGSSFRFFNIYREQGINVFDGNSDFENKMLNDRLSIGTDYYLTEYSTIGFNASANLNSNENIADSKTTIGLITNSAIDSVLLAPNRDETDVQNYTANLNYRYKDTNNRVVEVDFDYVNYSNDRESLQPNIYKDPSEKFTLRESINFQETPIDIEVYSTKVDYEQPLKKGTLSTGAKISHVNTFNTFNFFDVVYNQNSIDSNRSNTFEYIETIAAAYVNYKFSHKKFKFQAGLRAEQTFSKGELIALIPDADSINKREYLNWFPSAGITYQLNKNNSTALIYSRRIERPNYQNLNPFESQINELSFRRGNPFLQPQFTHNIKLSNTYKYTLNTSFTFSYISDYFAEVTEAEGLRKSFINTRNVADQQVYNFSLSYPKKIKKWWNVYGSLYGYYTKFTANHPDFIPIDRIVYGGYAQSTFTLPKNYKAELSGWYSSPSIWRGTFRTKSIGSLNLAVQKSWKQWTTKLSFNDILYTVPWRADNRFGNLYLNGTGGSDSRNVRVYISYNFGQKDVKTAKSRKSGAEEEQNRLN